MRHIVLYEPDASGHRLVYVRYILEAIARAGGMRATLVTSRRVQELDWTALRARLGDRLAFHVVDEAPVPFGLRWLPAKLALQFARCRQLRAAVRALGTVDHVFVPFVDDYCLFPFAWRPRPFGRTPWSGIAVRPRFHLAGTGAQVPPRKEDRVEAWAYRRLLRDRSLATLFSIDPYIASALGDPRVVAVCDPADIADERADREWLPAAPDAVVLLVYGYVDHRKAIDRLLAVAADPRMPAALTVALVGAQDAGMAPVLRGRDAGALRARGRLIEVARRVSDAEEAAAFARADIVWGYYPGNYCSSGAMVRAGLMERPLMATQEGLVGLLTRQSGSGLTAPEADDEALLEGLSQLAGDAGLRARLGQAGRRRFAASTGAAFGDRIAGGL
uniref:glycosyltransferase n=1 Tax=Sphingomonas bacterium TaxID=1895847 RepID=UPI0015762E1D